MYVDAIHDRDSDKIHVVERTPDGKRRYQEYPANYVLYYSDPKGKYRSLYGDSVSRFSTRKRSEFEKEKRIQSNKEVFESDINVVFRCLSDNYLNVDAPKLHTLCISVKVLFKFVVPNVTGVPEYVIDTYEIGRASCRERV